MDVGRDRAWILEERVRQAKEEDEVKLQSGLPVLTVLTVNLDGKKEKWRNILAQEKEALLSHGILPRNI